MSRTRLHLSTTAPTLFQASTHLARRLFSFHGAAAITFLALVILFVLLLRIYAKWFLQLSPGSFSTGQIMSLALTPRPPNPTSGLDDSTVASISCFVYDPSVHRNQYGSDCAVCLSEFEENDEGRELPQCGHCFHMECVDKWLRSHSTCPICRAPIDVAEQSMVQRGKDVLNCT